MQILRREERFRQRAVLALRSKPLSPSLFDFSQRGIVAKRNGVMSQFESVSGFFFCRYLNTSKTTRTDFPHIFFSQVSRSCLAAAFLK